MSLFIPSLIRATNSNGAVLPKAWWRFYRTGTLDSISVYSDGELETPLTNPVEADSGGKFVPIYLDDSETYRAVLTPFNSVDAVHDIDPYNAPVDGELSVTDLGAVDGEDSTEAFEAAIYEALPERDRLRVYVPPGTYIISRQLIFRRLIELVGAGAGSARLVFTDVASINATMKGAISLGLPATLTAYTTNPNDYPVAASQGETGPSAGGSDFSQIRDLSIYIEGTRPAGFDYGIWSAARVTVENVHAHYCGFKILGGTLAIGSGDLIGNANLCYFANCRSFYATEDGFQTDGGDANGGAFVGCKVYKPARIGFHDGSYYGNSYIAPLREGVVGTTVSSYKSVASGGVNRSTFHQPYSEADEMSGPNYDIDAPGMIIQPMGAQPETDLGGFKNTIWWNTGGGPATTRAITIVQDGDGSVLGSASVRAARLTYDGLYIRAADNSVFDLIQAGGDGVYARRDGVAVTKFVIGAAIPDLTVSATSGSLPTANGSLTIADAATPTVAELLEFCRELQAKQEAILARMRALTPTIAT